MTMGIEHQILVLMTTHVDSGANRHRVVLVVGDDCSPLRELVTRATICFRHRANSAYATHHILFGNID